eukprot:13236956-Ditylum_brightwellii.AAC.1
MLPRCFCSASCIALYTCTRSTGGTSGHVGVRDVPPMRVPGRRCTPLQALPPASGSPEAARH